MNVGYENEKKEELKIFILRIHFLIWELEVEGKPKFVNQIKYSLHTVSENIILGTFIFIISLINIESGRKLRRVADLEEKNKRRLYMINSQFCLSLLFYP